MASPASSSPTTAEEAAAVQQESLEEAYVRLNTQLLRHLQRLDTGAALRTAEVIRDVLLHSSSSTADCSDGASSGSTVADMPSGADLFYGSPAEQLLQLRGQLKTLALGDSASLYTDDDSDEADESQSTASETGSGSSTVRARSNDDTDSLEADETGLVRNSEVDDYAEGAEEVAVAGSSSSSRQQRQQFAAVHLLEEALKVSSKAPTKAARASPSGASSASSGTAVAVSSSLIAPAKKRASKPDARQPRLQPSPHNACDQDKVNMNVEEMGRNSWVPSGTASPLPPPRENAAGDVDDEDLNTDADAVWVQMRAQVAKEMDRLAVVRKHR